MNPRAPRLPSKKSSMKNAPGKKSAAAQVASATHNAGPLKWNLDAVGVEAGDLPGIAAVDTTGVMVRYRAGRALLGQTWHHPDCGRGKGEVLESPLSEHPPLESSLWCACQPLCLATGGQARMKELAQVGRHARASEKSLLRMKTYRPHSAGWLSRRRELAGNVAAAEAAAGSHTSDVTREWAQGVWDRLEEQGRKYAAKNAPRRTTAKSTTATSTTRQDSAAEAELVADVVALLELGPTKPYRTVRSVAHEGWRQGRLAGENRRYVENRVFDAVAGRWDAAWDTGAEEPPKFGRLRQFLFAFTMGHKLRRWGRHLDERVRELVSGDGVAVVWAPNWHQHKVDWNDAYGSAVTAAAYETWGQGDGRNVVVVPANCGGLVAELLDGTVVGTGSEAQAEVCARLLCDGVDATTAWAAASAAVA